MPAPLAPFVGFALGVLLAWAGSDELSRGSGALLASRSFAVAALFALLVFGPFAGYFLAFYPDWSVAYYFDARRAPAALLLVTAFVDVLAVPFGFFVAARHVRRRHNVALLPLFTVPLALAAIALAVASRRLALYGTYVEVERGLGARPLSDSPIAYAILWFYTCLAAGIAWSARELRRAAAADPTATAVAARGRAR